MDEHELADINEDELMKIGSFIFCISIRLYKDTKNNCTLNSIPRYF